jgi:hypothetical protein
MPVAARKAPQPTGGWAVEGMDRHRRDRKGKTMKRMFVSLAVMLAAWGGATATTAQPPDGEFEPPPRRQGPPGGRRPPPDPLRAALDANHDHELDADEITNAAAAVALLDEDGDGRLDERELMPPPPPPPRGFEGRPPRDRRGSDGAAPSEADERGPRERPGFRPPEPGDRPSPERFVGRAMAFDADGDGKLDRSELEKWAGEMFRMRGDPEAGRRGPPPRGGGQDGEAGRSRRPRRPPAATDEAAGQPE